MGSLKEFVDEIIADGIITAEEHEQFMEIVHADGVIDEEESAQIARIFSLVSQGKVKIVDEAREGADRAALEAAKAEAIQKDMEAEEERKQRLAEEADEKAKAERKRAIAQVLAKVRAEEQEQTNGISKIFK